MYHYCDDTKKKLIKNKNKINVNLYKLTNKFVYECYKFNY